MMNTRHLISAFLLMLPLTMWAQDDAYFFSKKKSQTQVSSNTSSQSYRQMEIVYEDEPLDISGSNRDVDEYNRRGYRTTGQAQLVQQADGTFKYQLPGNDTLYIMTDTMTVTTGSLANQAYAQGYNEGFSDAEDYMLTRRMGRFSYASVYSSPWYWSSRYDPFYWDDWYWGDPYYYGYYSWNRPYWGYSSYYGYYGYRPYWYYGSYYGWGYPYRYYGYGSWHGGRHNSGYVTRSGRTPGRTGRDAGRNINSNHRGYSIGGRNTDLTGGRVSGNASSRSNGNTSGNRTYTPQSNSSARTTISSPSFGGASSRGNSSSSTRSSGGGSYGGSRASGGGGGHTGGSRGSGSGRGR